MGSSPGKQAGAGGRALVRRQLGTVGMRVGIMRFPVRA